MSPANIIPIGVPRPPAESCTGARHEYRVLVEAIQSGDLGAARQAYARLSDALPRAASAGTGSGDALSGIGTMLGLGDLAAAQRALQGLENKALQVLRDAAAKRSPSPATGVATATEGAGGRILRITI